MRWRCSTSRAGDTRADSAGHHPARTRVIGISIRNIDDQTMRNTRFLYEDDRAVISLVRTLTDQPIVLGGAGYSMFPDAILADTGADLGIEGEGEVAFLAVIEALEKGGTLDSIPGVHVKNGGPAEHRGLIRNMADSPLPDPALVLDTSRVQEDTWVPVQTRRGCPFNCSYCSTASIEGRILRKRDVESVVEWIAKLKGRGAQALLRGQHLQSAAMLCHGTLRGDERTSLDVAMHALYPWCSNEELTSAMAGGIPRYH